MGTFRAFIAVELSTETRAVLEDVIGVLTTKVDPGVVKWVAPERMHLTLRFLGDTPVERMDELSAGLDRVAAQHKPFTLTLDKLGCFPHERKPRVIWAGVRGDVAQACALRASLDEMLQTLGWEPGEKSFQPHLTLGRVKEQRASIDLPWGREVAGARTTVHEVTLFESVLRREGPLYIARHRSRLARES